MERRHTHHRSLPVARRVECERARSRSIVRACDSPGNLLLQLTLCESDTDAQIARCKKRIAEGIMPQVFENRLREFSKIKEQEM